MKVSPHTHAESPLTGSTLANLIRRAKELGRTHFAYTDHGHLSSTMKAYKLCKSSKEKTADEIDKKSLKFIPGLEFYFRDQKFLAGTKADRCKYFTATVHCRDQEAYTALGKIMSREDLPFVSIYEERQKLWNWETLREIAAHNVTLVLGGVHCMVGKPMLAGSNEVSVNTFKELLSIFGKDRLFVSLLAEPWAKKWSNVVEVQYTDTTRDSFLTGDQVTTDKARRIKVLDLVTRTGHTQIESRSDGIVSYNVGKDILDVKLHKGFLPLPGGDAILRINKLLKALAGHSNVKVLVTDYAYFAKPEDKIVQTMRLEGRDKLHPTLSLKNEEEVTSYFTNVMKLSAEESATIISNNDVWASSFDSLDLKFEWHLADSGGDPLKQVMAIIKENGRMKWEDPKYVARLKEELEVIAKNPVKDLTAYFLPIRDVLNHYREKGFLTGPGRGSAGGSLLCYLMGITQIDPFEYDLPFQRFFSMDRIMGKELPDIDVDLEDRVPLVGEDGKSGYLYGRWGDKAAQISTRTTIRLKSAIKEANRYFNDGKVEPEIEKLSEGLPAPPQGINDLQFVFGYEDTDGHHLPGLIEQSDKLKAYTEDRPNEWEIVSKAMGLTGAFSKHASAFVLSDVPIQDVAPTKDGHVTQYEAKEVEAVGLIKYDFLVINQLKDIRVCLDLINKRNDVQNNVGYFAHEDQDSTYIWKLPHDPEVYKSIWAGATETIFQISTQSMTPYVMEMLPTSIMDLATILALVRPGPMDFVNPDTGRNMVQEYMLLRRGEVKPDIQELADLLPETFGVIVFQEQLGKIARDLCGFAGPDAETLRANMAKKRMEKLMFMKPKFMEGAIKKVKPEVAEVIWERMVTFGRYGFSIIHAVEYAHITYACMFLKHHYNLEWWAAVLTNADEKEITGKLWPYVSDLVTSPDINLSSDTMVVDYANKKIRAKLGVIRGMGEKTANPIVAGRPYKDIQDFVEKAVAGEALTRKLIHVGVLDSLFPGEMSFLDKLQIFEDSMELRKWKNKTALAAVKGKTIRSTGPSLGEIPEEFKNLSTMDDAMMKKAVLPSMHINLNAIAKKHSRILDFSYNGKTTVMAPNGKTSPLLNGEALKRLADVPMNKVSKDIYVAATCFVMEAKEFPYSNNTKRALKMVIDVDGETMTDLVLWPDYKTGTLSYPATFKKGVIATVFFRKKTGKKELSIQSVYVEAAPKAKAKKDANSEGQEQKDETS